MQTQDFLQSLKDISEYIDKIDYSSYTLQYPPVFIWKSDHNQDDLLDSFSDDVPIWLYIHIPFCTAKCTFCRYFSFESADKKLFEQYIYTVIREIDIYKHAFGDNKKISSLYIWWWTPNIIDTELLDMLLWHIYKNFSFTSDFQFCIEFNPHESTKSKLEVIKKYKCHRLTVWVQSLDEKVLSIINRPQLKSEVRDTISYARSIWIPHINIDLMLWIRWQTVYSFIKDLLYMIRLQPDMIHLHPFCPTKRTVDSIEDANAQKNKEIMEKIWVHILKKFWYWNSSNDAMSISKWSENKQLSDAMKLWKYLWVWVSAVSFNWKFRWINTNSINDYISLMTNNIVPVKFSKKLTQDDNMRQYAIYNMRYKKMYFDDFFKLFWKKFTDIFSSEIEKLIDLWIVIIKNDMILYNYTTPEEFTYYSKVFYSDWIRNSILEQYE